MTTATPPPRRRLRRTIATVVAATAVAAPLTLLGASPASAAEREFRYAGADIEFEVDRDDGRYEVEVDIDDAKKGSKWRVTLWQNGKRFHQQVHVADDDDAEVEKDRPNTRGRDVFKLEIKKIGGPNPVTRTITVR